MSYSHTETLRERLQRLKGSRNDNFTVVDSLKPEEAEVINVLDKLKQLEEARAWQTRK